MLEQLTPRVYHLRFSKTNDRPSLGYIRGDRFSLMVDAGNTPEHAQAYLTAVQQMQFRKPDFVALTHSHWDHCFGLCALDFPSIACVETRQSLEKVSRLQWTRHAMAENAKKGILPSLCVPAIQAQFPDLEKIRIMLPTITFQESLTLDLGNCTCILQRVISPHARDTTIIYVPTERMVFLGDCVYQEPVGDSWIERPQKLQQLSDTLATLDFAIGQPAHQSAMTKMDLLQWFSRRIEQTKS